MDSPAEIDGATLETLLLQVARAHHDSRDLGYKLSFWRTRSGLEVDLVLYGERELVACEIKRADRIRAEDTRGLRAFAAEYPPGAALPAVRG